MRWGLEVLQSCHRPDGDALGRVQILPHKGGDVMQMKLELPIPEGYVIKFVPYITKKDGTRLYAKHYGKKAFPIVVKAP